MNVTAVRIFPFETARRGGAPWPRPRSRSRGRCSCAGCASWSPGAGGSSWDSAPHAGYIYSGQVAADAFAQARGETYDTVVILGANHTRAPFGGVAVYPGSAFRTPLGAVEVDRAVPAALVDAGRLATWDAGPHDAEHSVEVQVPFVQRLWPAARIVPIVVGTDDPAVCTRVGQWLARALARRRALIVASSDLSHYPPAAVARDADRRTLEAMATLDPGTLDAVARQVGGQDCKIQRCIKAR